MVQFCPTCGTLLDESLKGSITCTLCGKTSENKMAHHVQTSVFEMPSKLRKKKEEWVPQRITREVLGSGPVIEVECVRCPSKEVTYAQVQLRSADEGTTIFYQCLGCAYRWQENN